MKFEKNNRTLTVVGGGVAGSLCALVAAISGYQVRLLSKGSDPRIHCQADPFSSTFGGEDSRYVTLTEGHPYLGTTSYVNQMYPDMQRAFSKSIHDGGWLSQSTEQYSFADQAWLSRRYKANEDNTAIAELFEEYISENHQSLKLWQQLFCDYPQLQDGISLNNSGILRLYGDHDLWKMARTFHAERGVLLDSLSADQITQRFSIHAEGVRSGFIKGALIVDGLSFRVQRLVMNFFDELEKRGAELVFNCEVTRILRNDRGAVTGLLSNRNEKFSSDHYSLHLGAYDTSEVLKGADIENEIAGVAGGWLMLPKPQVPFLPLKVHDGQHLVFGREMPVVDLNINPARLDDGREVLIVGGGYLFAGKAPFEIPDSSKKLMQAEIHRVTELVLGSHYRSALKAGLVQTSSRICVRSFTPTDAELRKTIATSTDGVLVVGGGGNTGTTAKAAWVANEIVNKMRAADGVAVTETRVA